MNSLNYPLPLIFNGPSISCILSAPFVFQLTRRTSHETQQMFDWFISILNFSQVYIFVFCGLVYFDPTSQQSVVNCCFSFSLPVSRFWQRPESSLCTCLSGPRCKINAFKSKKLRVRWKSSELKDNFVVNMVGAGRWAEAVDFLPARKQLGLTVMSFIFLSV